MRRHHVSPDAAELSLPRGDRGRHSRRVLSWRLSTTLKVEVCADALDDAIAHFGPPETMNTNQGSQFTAFAWTDLPRKANVRISMEGKERVFDNILIERLSRSVKCECVYLPDSEARAGLRLWNDFYNYRRPHTALDGRPPDVVCRTGTTTMQPEQEAQRVAPEFPDPAQGSGNTSHSYTYKRATWAHAVPSVAYKI